MSSHRKTSAWLRARLPSRPELAVVLGSGFASILEAMEISRTLHVRTIPGFLQPNVDGHAGKLVLGRLEGTEILALCGRSHYYEGHSMAQISFPIRVLAELGVRTILLTNAAGGINRKFRPGEFMCLTDHINFMGVNPLRGEFGGGGNGFVDLTEVYDRALIHMLKQAARWAKVRLHSGVYLAVCGPTYETPAEIQAFARLGADAVGMSTVPEAVVARQCGLRVAGLSWITNLAAGKSPKPISHYDVLEAGKQRRDGARRLLAEFVKLYAKAKG